MSLRRFKSMQACLFFERRWEKVKEELKQIQLLGQRIFHNLSRIKKDSLDKESLECLENAKAINTNMTKRIYELEQKEVISDLHSNITHMWLHK